MSDNRMETLRQQGLERVRENDPEGALPLFDQALALCEDAESAELVRINKSFALIALERFDTPEVRELPAIVLRRRTPRHTYLAAYQLARRFRLEQNLDRARHYARIAVDVTEQADDQASLINALTELGNVEVFDSNFESAIRIYQQTLELLPEEDSDFKRFFLLQNLGYATLLLDQPAEGVALIHQALELMESLEIGGYLAESYIDLCHGYLALGELEKARFYGELGLEHLVEARQERNVRYLLGEIAYETGDFETAELHFGHLAAHYPDFPQLRNLLLAVNLRSMINWKLS